MTFLPYRSPRPPKQPLARLFFFFSYKDGLKMINSQNDCESYSDFKNKTFLISVKQKKG